VTPLGRPQVFFLSGREYLSRAGAAVPDGYNTGTMTAILEALDAQRRLLRLYGWTEEQIDDLPSETLIYNKDGRASGYPYPTDPHTIAHRWQERLDTQAFLRP